MKSRGRTISPKNRPTTTPRIRPKRIEVDRLILVNRDHISYKLAVN
jgi:hypothetical protein